MTISPRTKTTPKGYRSNETTENIEMKISHLQHHLIFCISCNREAYYDKILPFGQLLNTSCIYTHSNCLLVKITADPSNNMLSTFNIEIPNVPVLQATQMVTD